MNNTINNHQWEQIIRNYLQKLQVLRLTMRDKCTAYENMQEQVLRDDHREFYDKKTCILDETIWGQSVPSNIHLFENHHLWINFLFNAQFWSIVRSLAKLDSFTVLSLADTFHPQLQVLFDRAPHLNVLTIEQNASLPLQMALFKYTNASIRRLYFKNFKDRFNGEECMILAQS
ncbi:unnamed protein product [Rotaria sp. Silwood1]|nr:unnamed protein product [Rotaria sp. Silwood1]CAF1632837.1 unnamed protein product [Rotaria sp. Silwood1]CAF3735724.1 unnamed protein product [Rotaria sp. Silwood1]CAF3760772.1 unnamed protein product [Rotaria sp. Silwood1]CAF3788795.1 unnamed protein product [Rotaria sp. Silwood1]